MAKKYEGRRGLCGNSINDNLEPDGTPGELDLPS